MKRKFQPELKGIIGILIALAIAPHSVAVSWIEQNQGQTDSGYDYIVHAKDLTALTSNTHIELLLSKGHRVSSEDEESGFKGADAYSVAQAARVRLTLEGSNKNAASENSGRLASTSNYFKGSKDQWITRIPHFDEVRYSEVYPGIDVVYRLNEGQLEYDFIVSPGADSGAIALSLDGATNASLGEQGMLEVETPVGRLTQTIPSVYQIVNGARQPIDGEFVIKETGHIGFALAENRKELPVVIDPVIEFSGYFGGSGNDTGGKLQQKPNGNYVLMGQTTSLFEVVVDPSELRVTTDVFIAELDKTTGEVLWVTVLGGRRSEASQNMRVDSDGNPVIVGYTSSADYPTANALQPTFIGNNTSDNSVLNSDGFVSKLSADGSSLIFSTYLGGTDALPGSEQAFGFELFRAIDLDADDNIYVAGQTAASDYPVTTIFNGFGCFERELDPNNPPPTVSSSDIAFTKLSPSGTLLFSTCIGGSARDAARNVRVQSDGSVFIAGFSRSSDFPVTSGAFQAQPLVPFEYTPFVLRLAPDLSTITMASLVGDGFLQMIDVDAVGNVYGVASSRGLSPATPGAFQQTSSDVFDDFEYKEGYVFKLSADGTSLIYGTYLGAEGYDSLSSIRVDDEGRAYVSGSSSSPMYPLKNPLNAPPTPILRNTDLWFPSSGFNHISRGSLDNSETVFTLLAKNGTNLVAFGDQPSMGQVVPFFPDGGLDTAAMAYSQYLVAPGSPAYVVAANRNGANDIYEMYPQDFLFELTGDLGGAVQTSTSIVADFVSNLQGFPNFYIGNYGDTNTFVRIGAVTVLTPTGRSDGNTTAVAKLSILELGVPRDFIAVANEFQDIRLYNSTSTTLGPAIVIGIPAGPVTAMQAGDIDGDGVDELVIASADRPVEVVRFGDSGAVASVDLLNEANVDNLSLLMADVDGDSDPDIVVGRLGNDKLFLNDGSGNFIYEPSYTGNVQATKSLTTLPLFSGNGECPCFGIVDENPQELLGGGGKIALSVLSADGSSLEFSTLLSSGGRESLFLGMDFATGSDSKLLIAGNATGDAWPLVTSSSDRFESNDAVFMVLELDQDGDNALDGNDNCTNIANSGQNDTDADGYGNDCDADFNNDCTVNFLDISAFANAFLGADPLFDLNSDGAVNFVDFSVVSTRFLQPPGPGLGDCEAD